MLHRLTHTHSDPHGTTIDGVRVNDVFTNLAFLGRRRQVYRRIVDRSGARPGDRVLDIGCGSGYLVRLLAAAVGQAGTVTGVDPSEPAITEARRRGPGNATFTVGIAQHLDVPDDSVDVVTSTLAVHHIPETDRVAAFAEIYRVIRPGGRILVADFRASRVHPIVKKAMRHGLVDVEQLVSAAGFHVADRGDLPMLRYVAAIRPAAA